MHLLILPLHPVVVLKMKIFRIALSMCLQSVHSFQPVTFRNYVRSSLRIPALHSAFISCIHLSTALLRQRPSFPFRKLHSCSQSLPKHFSLPIPMVYFHFLRRVSPDKTNPNGFAWNDFFFQNKSKINLKDKYNKDFSSIILTDKK